MQQKAAYLKSLRIVHLALLAVQCLMLATVLYLVMQKTMPAAEPALDKTLQVAALLVSFGAVFGATGIFKKRLASIPVGANSQAEKANQYRMANIIQWALLEAASLFSSICFLLTGNYAFAALAIALIVYFAMLGPSKLKAMLQLQLSEQEADALQ
ncbi:MAG: hypothetical protein ABJC98_16630 [Bacteroidota bacterium]